MGYVPFSVAMESFAPTGSSAQLIRSLCDVHLDIDG